MYGGTLLAHSRTFQAEAGGSLSMAYVDGSSWGYTVRPYLKTTNNNKQEKNYVLKAKQGGSELRKLRQEHCQEFEVDLVYIVSSRPARAT